MNTMEKVPALRWLTFYWRRQQAWLGVIRADGSIRQDAKEVMLVPASEGASPGEDMCQATGTSSANTRCI